MAGGGSKEQRNATLKTDNPTHKKFHTFLFL
jgi:hypothetical protein